MFFLSLLFSFNSVSRN